MKLRCSCHAWVDVIGTYVATLLYITQGIATNSKAITSCTQIAMQLDTKLAFLIIALWKQF